MDSQYYTVKHHLKKQTHLRDRRVKFIMDKGADQTGIQTKVNDFLLQNPTIIVHDIVFTATPTNPRGNQWQIWSVMIDYEVDEAEERNNGRQVEFLMDKGFDQTGIEQKVNDFLGNHQDIIVHDIEFAATPTNLPGSQWQIWSVMIDYEVKA